MTRKQQEQRAIGSYQQYLRSGKYDLKDCYGSFSKAKANAWRDCIDFMNQHNGEQFRIISHNTNIFTCGFTFKENDIPMFMYITPTYRVAVEVSLCLE